MSGYHTSPKADDDIIDTARWIQTDNPAAARHFLDMVFEVFERLAQFPASGAIARLKHRRLAKIRFCVMPPPFNRWIVFYRMNEKNVEILRVIYGTQNWRGNPASFFF